MLAALLATASKAASKTKERTNNKVARSQRKCYYAEINVLAILKLFPGPTNLRGLTF